MLKDFITGLCILRDYDETAQMSAEHDIIYLGPNSRIVSTSDIEILDRLGFHVDKEYCGFYYFT